MERRPHSPAPLRCLVGALALALAGGGLLSAADAAKKPKITLSPEKETKLGEVMKKAAQAKRKYWVTRMKKEVERVTRTTGLDAERTKALEAIAEQSIDACLDGWTATFAESWRSFISQQLEVAPELDQIVAQLDQSAQMDWYGDYVRPYDHPQWTAGLLQTLSGEQFAAWEKAQKARFEEIQKEAGAAIKAMTEQSGEQQRRMYLAKGAAIKAALSLAKDRADKLDTLAATATAGTAESLRARGEKIFFSMEDEQRKQLVKTRQFYLGFDEKDAQKQEAVWNEGLAAVLSPEEIKQLATAKDAYKARRAVVMGRIMLTQFDERVAFTASQRERLQPIAERLVKEQTALFPENDSEGFYRIDPQLLLTAGMKATEDEMKAILDAPQWSHWQETAQAKNVRPNRIIVAPRRVAAPPATPKPAVPAPEPEDIEHAFSDFLHQRSGEERSRLLAVNLLKAEDAARVARLAPEVTARLQTAARGTAEETLATWKTSTDNSVRSQVRDATPESVRQRLAAMESYTYSQSNRSGQPGSVILDKALKAELTEADRSAWQKELDERNLFRDRAIAALILSEFDRKIPLAPAQWNQLEPKLAAAVGDYTPDIAMIFSSNYPYSWYLQSYSMFIPIAALPEKELKGILSKEQWERWSSSEEIGNTSNYWENVQRYHTQRLKEKK